MKKSNLKGAVKAVLWIIGYDWSTLTQVTTKYFSILYNFKQNPSNNYNYLYNLPNLVRRYLEAFLGFKIPKAVGLTKKLKELIDDEILAEKVLKFIHQYSHHSSLPRSLQFPDLEECTDVVDIVLKSVENKDKEHYDALIEAITV